ncbi:MAG: endonuclease/exonuclease/phosphatase family protein [Planctomycetaceae bacterium]
MSTEIVPSPAVPSLWRRLLRQCWSGGFMATLMLAAVIWNGSRTVPADPCQPIVLRGEVPLAESTSDVLRVATFNIHSGRGRDRQYDLARTATVFPTPPDLLGLNEVRGTWHESRARDQGAELGIKWGMQSAFVPTERRWWHDHFGNAVLTRVPIHQIHRLPLAGLRGKAFRTATLVQFEFHGRPVQLLSVHVDSQTDRERQLHAVLSLFTGLQPPVILIGDLNSDREDPQLKSLLARPDVVNPLKDAPADSRGRLPIDWILARGFRSRSGQLIENDASDHPAAIAELELE